MEPFVTRIGDVTIERVVPKSGPPSATGGSGMGKDPKDAIPQPSVSLAKRDAEGGDTINVSEDLQIFLKPPISGEKGSSSGESRKSREERMATSGTDESGASESEDNEELHRINSDDNHMEEDDDDVLLSESMDKDEPVNEVPQQKDKSDDQIEVISENKVSSSVIDPNNQTALQSSIEAGTVSLEPVRTEQDNKMQSESAGSASDGKRTGEESKEKEDSGDRGGGALETNKRKASIDSGAMHKKKKTNLTGNDDSLSSSSDSDDLKGDSKQMMMERKVANMRRNIREVMSENQLDEETLAAQRQEMERLRRVQEQQRIIREVQRQIALNRQNNKTQTRVISLLQGNSSLLKQIPSTSSSSGGSTQVRLPNTVLVKLASGSGQSSGTGVQPNKKVFELLRVQKGATGAVPRPGGRGAGMSRTVLAKPRGFGPQVHMMTPSVSIAPVMSTPRPPMPSDSESEGEEDSEREMMARAAALRKVAGKGKGKGVVTIDSSSDDDDCILLSDGSSGDESEPVDDPTNSGMHTNDLYNIPDEHGQVLVNVGHPAEEPDIFLAPQIARVIKPHQIGGVRFLYDNVVESLGRFNTSTGFGCILAHSMGLGKTLQVISFCDVFLRNTSAKTVLCIMPINTLQNWLAEFNMWLPAPQEGSTNNAANNNASSNNNISNSNCNTVGSNSGDNSTSNPAEQQPNIPTESSTEVPLDITNSNEVRTRNFALHVLNDSHKTMNARSRVIQEWSKKGGVLLIGYELYRQLSLKRPNKANKKKRRKQQDDIVDLDEDDKNKVLLEEMHSALVKPGPDLVICDEGHRIKNSHASISQALKQIRSKRRVVLTGYPLQNNLLEYWCMVDFVRPNYLGTKTEFCNMFERPIQNGQCIDSTPQDIRLMRYRAHVLHSLLEGFVQRRSHSVLQVSLPQKEEYVLLLRMTAFQRKLYDTFMNEVVRTKAVPNPLKAFAVCCKIWNHPDVLYYFLKKRSAGEDVDLDLEEATATANTPLTPGGAAVGVAGVTPMGRGAGSKRGRGRGRSPGGPKRERKGAFRQVGNNKPAATITPQTTSVGTPGSLPTLTNTNAGTSNPAQCTTVPSIQGGTPMQQDTNNQSFNMMGQQNQPYNTGPYSDMQSYGSNNSSQYGYPTNPPNSGYDPNYPGSGYNNSNNAYGNSNQNAPQYGNTGNYYNPPGGQQGNYDNNSLGSYFPPGPGNNQGDGFQNTGPDNNSQYWQQGPNQGYYPGGNSNQYYGNNANGSYGSTNPNEGDNNSYYMEHQSQEPGQFSDYNNRDQGNMYGMNPGSYGGEMGQNQGNSSVTGGNQNQNSMNMPQNPNMSNNSSGSNNSNNSIQNSGNLSNMQQNPNSNNMQNSPPNSVGTQHTNITNQSMAAGGSTPSHTNKSQSPQNTVGTSQSPPGNQQSQGSQSTQSQQNSMNASQSMQCGMGGPQNAMGMQMGSNASSQTLMGNQQQNYMNSQTVMGTMGLQQNPIGGMQNQPNVMQPSQNQMGMSQGGMGSSQSSMGSSQNPISLSPGPQNSMGTQQNQMSGIGGPQNAFGSQQNIMGQQMNMMGGQQNSLSQQNPMGGSQNPMSQQNSMGGPQNPMSQQNSMGGPQNPMSQQNSMGGPQNPMGDQQNTMSQQNSMGGPQNPRTQQNSLGGPQNSTAQQSSMAGPQNPMTQQSTMGGPQNPVMQQSPMGGPQNPMTQQSSIGGSPNSMMHQSPMAGPQNPMTQQNSMGGSQNSVMQQSSMGGPQNPVSQQSSMGGSQNPMAQQSSMGGPQNPMAQQSSMGGPQNPMAQPSSMGGPQNPMAQQSSMGGPQNPMLQQSSMGGSQNPMAQQGSLGGSQNSMAQQTSMSGPNPMGHQQSQENTMGHQQNLMGGSQNQQNQIGGLQNQQGQMSGSQNSMGHQQNMMGGPQNSMGHQQNMMGVSQNQQNLMGVPQNQQNMRGPQNQQNLMGGPQNQQNSVGGIQNHMSHQQHAMSINQNQQSSMGGHQQNTFENAQNQHHLGGAQNPMGHQHHGIGGPQNSTGQTQNQQNFLGGHNPMGHSQNQQNFMGGSQNSMGSNTMLPPQNTIGNQQNTVGSSQNTMSTPENSGGNQHNPVGGNHPLGTPQSPMGIPQSPVTGPHNPMGMPQSPIGIPQSPVTGPQNQMTTSKTSVGTQQTLQTSMGCPQDAPNSMGGSQDSLGHAQKSMGASQTSVGSSQTQMGTSSGLMGPPSQSTIGNSSQSSTGTSQTPMGMPQSPVGTSQHRMGSQSNVGSSTSMSMPQSPMGMPQSPMGMPQSPMMPQTPLGMPQSPVIQQNSMGPPQSTMGTHFPIGMPQSPVILPQNATGSGQNPMGGLQNSTSSQSSVGTQKNVGTSQNLGASNSGTMQQNSLESPRPMGIPGQDTSGNQSNIPGSSLSSQNSQNMMQNSQNFQNRSEMSNSSGPIPYGGLPNLDTNNSSQNSSYNMGNDLSSYQGMQGNNKMQSMQQSSNVSNDYNKMSGNMYNTMSGNPPYMNEMGNTTNKLDAGSQNCMGGVMNIEGSASNTAQDSAMYNHPSHPAYRWDDPSFNRFPGAPLQSEKVKCDSESHPDGSEKKSDDCVKFVGEGKSEGGVKREQDVKNLCMGMQQSNSNTNSTNVTIKTEDKMSSNCSNETQTDIPAMPPYPYGNSNIKQEMSGMSNISTQHNVFKMEQGTFKAESSTQSGGCMKPFDNNMQPPSHFPNKDTKDFGVNADTKDTKGMEGAESKTLPVESKDASCGTPNFDCPKDLNLNEGKQLVELGPGVTRNFAIKDDPGIPYDWATELLKNYVPGHIENSAKMEVLFCILEESMALGDRMLVFSQSLFTLNLIEEFLQKTNLPGREEKWARNWNYYRLDGSTSALEREKLINEYNSNPNIHLFLVSTRAGSLGINLVGANRVVVFDASWNPCHDTQAVCRVYRYGQKKPCFVYRLVMDNCLEKKIYDRQINKQGMADRVVDECNPDAHLSIKEVTNLCWDNEVDSDPKDFSADKDKYIDVVMQKLIDKFSSCLSKEPFQHESLLVDRKEKKLSQAEKRLAKRSYELEKQANINYSHRPQYQYYPGNTAGVGNPGMQGTGLQIRAIRTDGTGGVMPKPVASVRPMQAELSQQLERGQTPRSTVTTLNTGGRSRWIPAEVWQRQGMSAQEMTLPLDVVIPTNSPDRASIVLKAGQRVMVLKSPKGIYMQLENGKIIAIRTAFKVGGAGKGAATQQHQECKTPPEKPEVASTDYKKDTNTPPISRAANANKISNVLPFKNNSAITIIPKNSAQPRATKPMGRMGGGGIIKQDVTVKPWGPRMGAPGGGDMPPMSMGMNKNMNLQQPMAQARPYFHRSGSGDMGPTKPYYHHEGSDHMGMMGHHTSDEGSSGAENMSSTQCGEDKDVMDGGTLKSPSSEDYNQDNSVSSHAFGSRSSYDGQMNDDMIQEGGGNMNMPYGNTSEQGIHDSNMNSSYGRQDPHDASVSRSFRRQMDQSMQSPYGRQTDQRMQDTSGGMNRGFGRQIDRSMHDPSGMGHGYGSGRSDQGYEMSTSGNRGFGRQLDHGMQEGGNINRPFGRQSQESMSYSQHGQGGVYSEHKDSNFGRSDSSVSVRYSHGDNESTSSRNYNFEDNWQQNQGYQGMPRVGGRNQNVGGSVTDNRNYQQQFKNNPHSIEKHTGSDSSNRDQQRNPFSEYGQRQQHPQSQSPSFRSDISDAANDSGIEILPLPNPNYSSGNKETSSGSTPQSQGKSSLKNYRHNAFSAHLHNRELEIHPIPSSSTESSATSLNRQMGEKSQPGDHYMKSPMSNYGAADIKSPSSFHQSHDELKSTNQGMGMQGYSLGNAGNMHSREQHQPSSGMSQSFLGGNTSSTGQHTMQSGRGRKNAGNAGRFSSEVNPGGSFVGGNVTHAPPAKGRRANNRNNAAEQQQQQQQQQYDYDPSEVQALDSGGRLNPQQSQTNKPMGRSQMYSMQQPSQQFQSHPSPQQSSIPTPPTSAVTITPANPTPKKGRGKQNTSTDRSPSFSSAPNVIDLESPHHSDSSNSSTAPKNQHGQQQQQQQQQQQSVQNAPSQSPQSASNFPSNPTSSQYPSMDSNSNKPLDPYSSPMYGHQQYYPGYYGGFGGPQQPPMGFGGSPYYSGEPQYGAGRGMHMEQSGTGPGKPESELQKGNQSQSGTPSQQQQQQQHQQHQQQQQQPQQSASQSQLQQPSPQSNSQPSTPMKNSGMGLQKKDQSSQLTNTGTPETPSKTPNSVTNPATPTTVRDMTSPGSVSGGSRSGNNSARSTPAAITNTNLSQEPSSPQLHFNPSTSSAGTSTQETKSPGQYSSSMTTPAPQDSKSPVQYSTNTTSGTNVATSTPSSTSLQFNASSPASTTQSSLIPPPPHQGTYEPMVLGGYPSGSSGTGYAPPPPPAMGYGGYTNPPNQYDTDYARASMYSAFHRPDPHPHPFAPGHPPGFLPPPPPPQSTNYYPQNMYAPAPYGTPDPAYYSNPFLNAMHQHPYPALPGATQNPSSHPPQ